MTKQKHTARVLEGNSLDKKLRSIGRPVKEKRSYIGEHRETIFAVENTEGEAL